MHTQEINLHVKYTRQYMTTGAFHEFQEGTKCIQFEVTGDDVFITVHAYFQPDGERFFRIVSDTFKEKCMCHTSKEMNVVRGFMNWLAENRDKVYPQTGDQSAGLTTEPIQEASTTNKETQP